MVLSACLVLLCFETRPQFVAQAGFELRNFLFQSPKCLDYRPIPLQQEKLEGGCREGVLGRRKNIIKPQRESRLVNSKRLKKATMVVGGSCGTGEVDSLRGGVWEAMEWALGSRSTTSGPIFFLFVVS